MCHSLFSEQQLITHNMQLWPKGLCICDHHCLLQSMQSFTAKAAIARLACRCTKAHRTLLSILSRWWKTAGSSSQGLYRSRRYVRLQKCRSSTTTR
jgi:hypothetical protein